MEGGNTDSQAGGARWDPARVLGNVNQLDVRLSRGFLRSKPEKWFPGFSAHWMPMVHSLGVNIKVLEVKPLCRFPSSGAHCYQCSVDGEPLSLFVDAAGGLVLLNTIAPDSLPEGANTVLEYMARRLLTSLASCWSGSESSVVRFEGAIDPAGVQGVAAIKLAIEVNAGQCAIWIVIGGNLATRLDGLWKRQLKAPVRGVMKKSGDVRIAAAELAVPTTMITEYLNSGVMVDLEIPVSDRVVLFADGKPWMDAKLLTSGGHFVVEIIGPAAPQSALPDGTTRLLVSLGNVHFDMAKFNEAVQPGSQFETGRDISDEVEIIVSDEKVADASLCTWQGRLAVRMR